MCSSIWVTAIDSESDTEYFSAEEKEEKSEYEYLDSLSHQSKIQCPTSEDKDKLNISNSNIYTGDTSQPKVPYWPHWKPPILTYDLSRKWHSSYWSWLRFKLVKPYYHYRIKNVVDAINQELAASVDALPSDMNIEKLDHLLCNLYGTRPRLNSQHSNQNLSACVHGGNFGRWFGLKKYSQQFAGNAQSSTQHLNRPSLAIERVYTLRTYAALGFLTLGTMAWCLHVIK